MENGLCHCRSASLRNGLRARNFFLRRDGCRWIEMDLTPPALKRVFLKHPFHGPEGPFFHHFFALKPEENLCRTSAERPCGERLIPCSETVRLEVTPWAASFAEADNRVNSGFLVEERPFRAA
jgi:hypothetical protein